MDSKPPTNPPKKHKFKPKPQILPIPKPEVKTELVEDIDTTRATELMRQFHERSLKGKAKTEKKVHASQIAFGLGAASTSLKSFGTKNANKAGKSLTSSAYSSTSIDKEYQEPWDYYSNYPVTLPLRPPYSGDPATMDVHEFGEAISEDVYDENVVSAAEELGLFEENVEPTMFFFQLPSLLPTTRSSATATDTNVDNVSTRQKLGTEKGCSLDNIPSGFMGKLLVYRSGALKLKLGETLYDVSPGMKCSFAQDVVALNTAEKRFCIVGDIEKRAVVTPDVDALLSDLGNIR